MKRRSVVVVAVGYWLLAVVVSCGSLRKKREVGTSQANQIVVRLAVAVAACRRF
jgi:hypothetical protein